MAADFRLLQQDFVSYIRDPNKNAVPANVDMRRMAIYRDLFFNNIDSFLSNNFPVLRSIVDDRRWAHLVRAFFSRHRCKTPYFSEIAEEFISFLTNENSDFSELPFLLELAHYEWVEMALENSREELVVNRMDSMDISDCNVSLSPLAWPLIYQFPVHRISPEFLPTEAPIEPTCLIVYRNREDSILFVEISSMTFNLLQLVEQYQVLSVQDCLRLLIKAISPIDQEMIMSGGKRIIKELAEKDIITLFS